MLLTFLVIKLQFCYVWSHEVKRIIKYTSSSSFSHFFALVNLKALVKVVSLLDILFQLFCFTMQAIKARKRLFDDQFSADNILV